MCEGCTPLVKDREGLVSEEDVERVCVRDCVSVRVCV